MEVIILLPTKSHQKYFNCFFLKRKKIIKTHHVVYLDCSGKIFTTYSTQPYRGAHNRFCYKCSNVFKMLESHNFNECLMEF